MSGRDAGVGWAVAKAKTKKQDDTMLEFRVAMTSPCTHKGNVPDTDLTTFKNLIKLIN